jgi:hypothetical protein
MRNLTLSLLLGPMLALLAFGCGSDDPPPLDPQPTNDSTENDGPDLHALYRDLGRTWVIRTELLDDDGNKRVTHERFTVIEVHEHGAVYESVPLDEQMQRIEGAPTERTEVAFVAPEFPMERDAEFELERISVSAGEFECYGEQRNDTRRWTAVQYPGLLVRMDAGAVRQELVEFGVAE